MGPEPIPPVTIQIPFVHQVSYLVQILVCLHNLIALALAIEPTAIWNEVVTGFSLNSFARHLFLIGIVVYIGMLMVKSLNRSRPDDSSEGHPTNEPET